MTATPDDLQERIQRFADALRQAGVKVTSQRLEVFHALTQSQEHPDAETIFATVRRRLPSVSRDTVYRTLWLLADLGLVSTLGVPRERFRFDGNMKKHHHFVCRRCGMTRDFYSEEFDGLRVPPEVEQLGEVETLQVEIRGLCQQCARSTETT